ncbi:MAG: peptide deformylase [bacterium]
MILPIYTDKHDILRQKTEPITEITPEIRQLAEDMRTTMHNAHGVGLAAPQVGKSVALTVIELVDEDPDFSIPHLALINPRVTWTGKRKVPMEEGCLSIPGVEGIVYRPDKVRVKALDLDGNHVEIECAGLLARVLQHEIDHLNGILFTSYLTKKQLRTRPLTDYPRY